MHIAQTAVYIMEKYYSIIEECPHETTETRVIESIATCETTAEFCIECGEQLTQPKTDC
ncbi:hypothetical protein [Flavobacterium sp.]|uniref:hypothetical protein n=1 Tax=Flavobacterium sp. TaxID=239 RepID=UPI0026121FDA|nr:hypothetical protein [Flavobacterium sp.]